MPPVSDEDFRKMAREGARINELLEKLVLFPGSVQEYSNFRGYDVEVVDTEESNKGVFFDIEQRFTDQLITLIDKKGVEALVNVSYRLVWARSISGLVPHDPIIYGLPVRKKNKPDF